MTRKTPVKERQQLMTITQVADYLQVNELTIRRRVAAGQLPAYKMGNKLLRFRPEDVDALLTPCVGFKGL